MRGICRDHADRATTHQCDDDYMFVVILGRCKQRAASQDRNTLQSTRIENAHALTKE